MEQIDKLIIEVEKLYREADSVIAAMGYDEGYYSGECNAYAEVLALLKNVQESCSQKMKNQ